MTEWTGVLATVAAVWGIIFTINSATTAFLQTKWIWNQKRLLGSIRDELQSIRAYLQIIVGDDIRKVDTRAIEEGTAGLEDEPCPDDEPPAKAIPELKKLLEDAPPSKGHARSRRCKTCGDPQVVCKC